MSQQELNQRIRDIFLGILRLTPGGKIGLPPMDLEGIRAMEIWAHVLEEMVLRHGPYPNGFTREILHSEPFPDFAGELAQRAASILASKALHSGDVLIKFGRAEYMRAFLEEGRMRVSAASHYARPDHNGAVRDDELSLLLSLSLNRQDILEIVANPEEVPSEEFQRVDIPCRSNADYWMYCLSTVCEPRLFVDFDADACIIVKDKARFLQLLLVNGRAKFCETTHRSGLVTYVDPLLPRTALIDVPMSKHFRYEYQKEFRFVWCPRAPTRDLPFVELQLGSLGDIAEIVTLDHAVANSAVPADAAKGPPRG